MTQQTALITGATSGIGTVITEHLVRSDYRVIILARSQQKMDAQIATLKTKYPKSEIEGILCDLSSSKSVLRACEEVKQAHQQIDLLLLNAGLWNSEFTETEDGIEETLQVNLLAPLRMFELLAPLIPRDGSAKVMLTASGLHQGTIQFDDIEFRNNFSGFKAYRQSKLGVILVIRHLAQQAEYNGISFYAVHPGMVRTELGRSSGWISRAVFRFLGKSVQEGAQTHCFLIDTNPQNLSNGEYYAYKKVTKTTETAMDMNLAEKLLDRLQEFAAKIQGE